MGGVFGLTRCTYINARLAETILNWKPGKWSGPGKACIDLVHAVRAAQDLIKTSSTETNSRYQI